MSRVAEVSLQSLFGAIAHAQTEADLRQSVVAALGEYFAARRWMLSFSDELPAIDQNTPKLMRLALSLDYNPVLIWPTWGRCVYTYRLSWRRCELSLKP